MFRRRQPPKPSAPQSSDFDPQKVDLVTQSPHGTTSLIIVQDQPWSGRESEWASLEQKIRHYTSFAVDGGMARRYPNTAGCDWRILIDNYFNDPPEEYIDALGRIGDAVRSSGGDLILQCLTPPSRPDEPPQPRGAWRLGTGENRRVPVSV